jgi:hypothetical protein
MVQCAKCGRQHTVWSGRHTQVGRLTRRIVDLWTGKFVDLWNCGFCETRESLKIIQISVSLLIDHSLTEVMKLKSSQSRER